MPEARNIRVQLIVHPAEGVSPVVLNSAVAHFLESKGFKVTLPHVYPDDPLIIECVELIPAIDY